MKNSKAVKGYLFVSGLLLTFVGALTTFNPVNIKANEGIEIAGNASALNDVRSIGMLLLATALFSILSAFKSPLRKSAVLSLFILFLSLGFGRILSMVLDGIPSDGMVKATGLEIVLGLIGLIIFLSQRKRQVD